MSNKHTFGRSAPSINAGSMADIAFLLLVFFLVSTTMDTDAGIQRRLAPQADAPPMRTPEAHVQQVLVNDAGELLVNGKPMPLADLRVATKLFLANPYGAPDPPKRRRITLEAQRRAAGQAADELWKERLHTVRMLGEYDELPPDAQIILTTGSRTSYDAYVKVQNELEGAVRELRDELALRKFGRRFTDLREHDPADRDAIRAIRMAYPQRISETDPVEAGTP